MKKIKAFLRSLLPITVEFFPTTEEQVRGLVDLCKRQQALLERSSPSFLLSMDERKHYKIQLDDATKLSKYWQKQTLWTSDQRSRRKPRTTY